MTYSKILQSIFTMESKKTTPFSGFKLVKDKGLLNFISANYVPTVLLEPFIGSDNCMESVYIFTNILQQLVHHKLRMKKNLQR